MQNSAAMRFDSNSSWSILSSTEQSIKHKIEQCGTKLADWDVSIFRGILTGYNDAFIISGEVKDSLIAQDPKSAEIIRPILRGRDIKRYSYEFADLWIIATFPSRHYDIDDYPAVKKHLLTFGMERLEQTGRKHVVDGMEVKARKKTSNKWYETQDSISYWDDFSKQKIVFAETMRVHRTQGADRFPRFSFVEEGFFQDKTCFMITGNDLYYILAIINSSLMNYYIHKNVAVLDTGGFLMQKIYVDCFPVPRVHEETYVKLTELSKEIVKRRKNNTDSFDLEDQVDAIVYEVFCLTDKEIRFIQENI